MLKLKALDELNKPYSIFTDYVEGSAIEQFVNVMKQPDVVQGALMPDVHAGYVLPIGGVVATKGTIYPAFVGYDIGCGVSAVRINLTEEHLKNVNALRDVITSVVPVGFVSHHHSYDGATLARRIGKSPDSISDLVDRHLNQVATLGGGNHFIEIGKDDAGDYWISIHSGSRGLGHSVATRFMQQSGGEGINPIDENSQLGKDYIEAMNYCLRWALFNREKMMRNICEALDVPFQEDTMINRNHNHAEKNSEGLWIHRKGATHAEAGMLGVIPANMRDGVYIVCGKGSADSLCSSSHGAGRVLSRSKAKKTITLADFREMMGDKVDGFIVDEKRIDECPAAYKPIGEVMANQSDLIDVIKHIKPIVNVKG